MVKSKKKEIYDFDNVWGDVDDRSEDTEFVGYVFAIFRSIFDLALLCIAAVFLVQHDKHDFPVATTLAKCIAAISTASLVLNFFEFFLFADPTEDSPLPIIFHFLLATGRLLIVVLGLVPKNSLKHIWIQYKRDERGGVIIALLTVVWLTDMVYCLCGMEVMIQFLIFPCWLPYHVFIGMPLGCIKKRAKANREVEDKPTGIK